jgi:hypothetical protein
VVVSPRQNRRDRDDERAVGPRRHETVEEWPDGDWVVRGLTGSAAGKTYRCPGCDQEIPAATPHLVAWPVDGGGPDDRRHWHRACWDARLRRGVKVHRSKNAPRYG